MSYQAADSRYSQMPYRRCGSSGLKLPRVSLGLWHNFGHVDRFDTAQALVRHAFDAGITHFDLANNYGPPPGLAGSVFGEILRQGPPATDRLILNGWKTFWPWPRAAIFRVRRRSARLRNRRSAATSSRWRSGSGWTCLTAARTRWR